MPEPRYATPAVPCTWMGVAAVSANRAPMFPVPSWPMRRPPWDCCSTTLSGSHVTCASRPHGESTTMDGAARASALGVATVPHDGVAAGGVPEPEPEPDDEDWEGPPQAASAASAATGVARSAAA